MSGRHVLLIDDNTTFLKYARRFFEYLPGFQVVGAYSSPFTAMKNVKRLAPDVCVVDVSMPGCNGLELIPQIRERVPAARIIMLTSHDDESYRTAAMEIGADAFVSKAEMDSELPNALSVAMTPK